MSTRLYTVAEAAKVLGINPISLRDRIRRGTLKAVKGTGIHANRWLVTDSELYDAVQRKLRQSKD